MFFAPELRKECVPAVVNAHLFETPDHTTRICKTNFMLGCRQSAATLPRLSTSPLRSRAHVRQKSLYTYDPRLRAVQLWNIGSSSGIVQQLSESTMILGLFKTVLKRSARIPILIQSGNGVMIERVRFQMDRRHSQPRRPRTATASAGWQPHDQTLLRLSHVALLNEHSVLKILLIIDLSGSSNGLRMNGNPHAIADVEERNLTTYAPPILPNFPSTTSLTFNTSASSIKTATSNRAHTRGGKGHPVKSEANYIYISSLLREPEAKWKRNSYLTLFKNIYSLTTH
ncbi:hypothetical protein BDZ89DRAFT_1234578 [Hymenopellis radicata]|nr:hypothetical protein BDZ89DRAFT_1234578 [Hymenopellis radicata]